MSAIKKFILKHTGFDIIIPATKGIYKSTKKVTNELDAINFLKKAKKTKKYNTFKWTNFSKYYNLSKTDTLKLKKKYYD